MSTCKTVTDIRKTNGGGRHEPRRNLGSLKDCKESERVLVQVLQCEEERKESGRTRNPTDSSLLMKDGKKEIKNSRGDRWVTMGGGKQPFQDEGATHRSTAARSRSCSPPRPTCTRSSPTGHRNGPELKISARHGLLPPLVW